jgi:DNA-binding response OmpR family regulator
VTKKKMNFETVSLADLAISNSQRRRDMKEAVVLVVDDDPAIADTLAIILEQSGLKAVVAYDGKCALEIARTASPDLLLTDVSMPGMSGIDLAMEIRRTIPKCEILLFSGTAWTADLLNSPRYAEQDFTLLGKPLHPTQLLARVTQSLASGAGQTDVSNRTAEVHLQVSL